MTNWLMQMLPTLKGKGLFVFSDAGGAKPVLSYIKLADGINDVYAVSDRTYNFYNDFGIKVNAYTEGSESEIIDSYQPDFVFTGTSMSSKIELRFIEEATKRKIPCYTFIDHYTNFRERFFDNGREIFPDYICVTDERAAALCRAANSHMPAENIFASGNYYHLFLKQWKPEVSKADFFTQHGIPQYHKVITYASDPLRSAGGKEKWGSDEQDNWLMFAEVIKSLGADNFSIVFKLHPNQKKENLLADINEAWLDNVIVPEVIDTNTLLYYSDAVVGMFSSILVESQLLGKETLRYMENCTTDPFADMQVGELINTKNQLTQCLIKILK